RQARVGEVGQQRADVRLEGGAVHLVLGFERVDEVTVADRVRQQLPHACAHAVQPEVDPLGRVEDHRLTGDAGANRAVRTDDHGVLVDLHALRLTTARVHSG